MKKKINFRLDPQRISSMIRAEIKEEKLFDVDYFTSMLDKFDENLFFSSLFFSSYSSTILSIIDEKKKIIFSRSFYLLIQREQSRPSIFFGEVFFHDESEDQFSSSDRFSFPIIRESLLSLSFDISESKHEKSLDDPIVLEFLLFLLDGER